MERSYQISIEPDLTRQPWHTGTQISISITIESNPGSISISITIESKVGSQDSTLTSKEELSEDIATRKDKQSHHLDKTTSRYTRERRYTIW